MIRLKKIFCVVLVLSLVLAVPGCGARDFDAAGYTQALLDQLFQGEVDAMMEFEEEVSARKLKNEYKDYISTFSEGLTEGLNPSEVTAAKFYTLCAEIFRAEKYSVESAEKISKEEYHVNVEIQPTDIFVHWKEMLTESMEAFQEKVENGEYKGTEAEILEQMYGEITAVSYALLETAYEEAAFGEKETVVLTIKRDENEKFGANDEEISDLVTKILCLDAIQD